MDLDVDTDLLSTAAEAVAAAAADLFKYPCVVVQVSADALGSTAVAYEAAGLLRQRAHQAATLPIAVHGQASGFGQALAACAAVFAHLEAGLIR